MDLSARTEIHEQLADHHALTSLTPCCNESSARSFIAAQWALALMPSMCEFLEKVEENARPWRLRRVKRWQRF